MDLGFEAAVRLAALPAPACAQSKTLNPKLQRRISAATFIDLMSGSLLGNDWWA